MTRCARGHFREQIEDECGDRNLSPDLTLPDLQNISCPPYLLAFLGSRSCCSAEAVTFYGNIRSHSCSTRHDQSTHPLLTTQETISFFAFKGALRQRVVSHSTSSLRASTARLSPSYGGLGMMWTYFYFDFVLSDPQPGAPIWELRLLRPLSLGQADIGGYP